MPSKCYLLESKYGGEGVIVWNCQGLSPLVPWKGNVTDKRQFRELLYILPTYHQAATAGQTP